MVWLAGNYCCSGLGVLDHSRLPIVAGSVARGLGFVVDHPTRPGAVLCLVYIFRVEVSYSDRLRRDDVVCWLRRLACFV